MFIDSIVEGTLFVYSKFYKGNINNMASNCLHTYMYLYVLRNILLLYIRMRRPRAYIQLYMYILLSESATLLIYTQLCTCWLELIK